MSNKMKISTSYKVFTTINYIVLGMISLVALYPLLYVAFASFSDGSELMKQSGLLLKPVGNFNLEAYKAVFKNGNIFRGYKNTILLLVFGIPYQVVMTSLAAYVLSRKNVLWKNVIMFFIIFTMFFQGGMIPFYLVIKNLHLRDSLLALILPFSINVYNMIIMRTSFAAIPDSLEESAKLDGASHWTILFRIVIPLSKPVIAVMFLYYGVATWNGWFWPSLFLSDRAKFPLQIILREILLSSDPGAAGISSSNAVDAVGIAETVKYATIVVSTLPILFVYPFIQKYFAKGVMIGAVKG
ncbi:carbohydrate ABC transporter permease [Clostridium grantii]|uniref:Putative aldouronate transport system permease protein n=1 Tax=Clostridium grantii DSM 8605 TaxID=1121316 RepID=A0A1M5XSC7_9CLOT|nr:carbohydrate ABC transporter permease [Clostridium grantii]SHI02669.1 putative aldouronate transport system permease protein [Clostridium grantii DSM 8605]